VNLLKQECCFSCRQGRNERSAILGTVRWCLLTVYFAMRPVRIHHIFAIPTARWVPWPHWELGPSLPKAVRDGEESLQSSRMMGDGPIFLKNLRDSLLHVPTYQMKLVSAVSISLASTFKFVFKLLKKNMVFENIMICVHAFLTWCTCFPLNMMKTRSTCSYPCFTSLM
jgi:hypothetical protein